MSRLHRAAIGDGVQKCLSPIERHVKANRKPKIARAPKSEAEEKSDQAGSQCSQPRFTLVAQMQRTERSGEKGGCRPESNAARQLATKNLEVATSRSVPDWLTLNKESLKGVVMRIPTRDERSDVA